MSHTVFSYSHQCSKYIISHSFGQVGRRKKFKKIMDHNFGPCCIVVCLFRLTKIHSMVSHTNVFSDNWIHGRRLYLMSFYFVQINGKWFEPASTWQEIMWIVYSIEITIEVYEYEFIYSSTHVKQKKINQKENCSN